MILFTAPDLVEKEELPAFPKIFLGGSIEQGKAVEWQQKIINLLKDDQCVIFNPRRENWDASWEQDIDNPQFKEQVTWEMDKIDLSDIIILYFDPETKSPITLLELGYVSKSGKHIFIYCPDGFFRKGNVDIVAEREKLPVYDNEEKFFKALKAFMFILNQKI